MKDKLLKLGFSETQTHVFVIKNADFIVTVYETTSDWRYTWESLIEHCGGGPAKLTNVEQLKFYLCKK